MLNVEKKILKYVKIFHSSLILSTFDESRMNVSNDKMFYLIRNVMCENSFQKFKNKEFFRKGFIY